MNKVFFDVGANDGFHSIGLAYGEPDCAVYGFEPTPSLADAIAERVVNLKNYHLIRKAVSDFNGKAVFNIAAEGGGGCSSLLQFSDKSQTDWPGRTDFVITETLEVDVIRLDTFIDENNIPKIDYLHVDTQGSDLKVLDGLGKYISIVTEGCIEAASEKDVLYFNQNTKDESVAFLEANGFEITDIVGNDPWWHEVNIYFKKR